MHTPWKTPLTLVLTAALFVSCNTAVTPAPKVHPTIRNDNAKMTATVGGVLTLDVLANDTPGAGNTLSPDTLDLDVQMAGVQGSKELPKGTFTVKDHKVQFTSKIDQPATIVLPYSVRDSGGEAATATMTVTLTAPETPGDDVLFSFEGTTEGWKTLNDGAGTVSVSSDFHTHGTQSLFIQSTRKDGDWFSVVKDLSFEGKKTLKFDLKTLSAGTSYNVALQTGPDWTWCQGADWTWVGPDQTVTATIDLSKVSCNGAAPDLKAVHAINLFFNQGDYHMDRVVVE